MGPTGGTGREFVDRACAAGHDVTAVIRSPGALVDRPNLIVVVAGEIAPVIIGQDAVVTAIGPRGRGPTTVQTDTVASLVATMRAAGVRRHTHGW